MKPKREILSAVLLGLLMLGVPTFAHHGTGGDDTSKIVTVKGAVTDFQYINPHVQIYVEAKDEQGNTQIWDGEASNSLVLHRAGWNSKIIKVGDQITLNGYQSKNKGTSLRLTSVVLADGRQLETFPRIE
jgi:DNA/RNA endonuclease YhcR with UshA esterase domain